jgi:hypothetical protein
MTVMPQLVQFGDLTPAHFMQHPVWAHVGTQDYDQPWYEEADEETFRPWTGSVPIDAEVGMFLVSARLVLADGTTASGFVTPQPASAGPHAELGTIQPQLFLPSGTREAFWDGMLPREATDRAAFYARIGKPATAVFPIRFAADQGLANGIQQGVIEGFYSLTSIGRPPVVTR